MWDLFYDRCIANILASVPVKAESGQYFVACFLDHPVYALVSGRLLTYAVGMSIMSQSRL